VAHEKFSEPKEVEVITLTVIILCSFPNFCIALNLSPYISTVHGGLLLYLTFNVLVSEIGYSTSEERAGAFFQGQPKKSG